jgi:hypothetical protein
MLGAIHSNSQIVFYPPGKGGTHLRFGSGPTLGGNGSQLDLFTSTQASEDPEEDDPLVKMARAFVGRPLDVEEEPVRDNNETLGQKSVRQRNAFDIRRNGHKW